MIVTLPILRAIDLLSPSQSCCHGLLFASLMLHSALLFCHPPNLASCCFPPTLAGPQVVLPNPGSSSSSSAELPTRFSMTRRFNMDQVPFNLDLLPKRTWGEEKDTTVSSCGAGSTHKKGMERCKFACMEILSKSSPALGSVSEGREQ